MNKKGFTLVEIMIVVAIIGLLAAIGIPSFQKARASSQEKACINNLRIIDGAKEQSAMENNNDISDTNVDSYIKGTRPTCPSDNSTYSLGVLGTDPACTFDATNHTL